MLVSTTMSQRSSVREQRDRPHPIDTFQKPSPHSEHDRMITARYNQSGRMSAATQPVALPSLQHFNVSTTQRLFVPIFLNRRPPRGGQRRSGTEPDFLMQPFHRVGIGHDEEALVRRDFVGPFGKKFFDEGTDFRAAHSHHFKL